jgi:hypothetical protein
MGRENEMTSNEEQLLANKLEKDLLMLFKSTMLSLEQLQEALNYSSVSAIRQSLMRGTLPVPVFQLPHRRGHFVLTNEVAKFLARQANKGGSIKN